MTKFGPLISIENHRYPGGQATLAELTDAFSVCFPLQGRHQKAI